MGWNRIKKMFKKKPKKDQVISFDGGEIGLKDVKTYKNLGEDLPMYTEFIGRENGEFVWNVNGKRVVSDSIINAQREYLRLYSKGDGNE